MPNLMTHARRPAAGADGIAVPAATGHPMPDAAASRHSPWRLPFRLALAGMLAVAAGILGNKFGPDGLLREDGFVESASAILFAIAAVGAALHVRGAKGTDWLALYVLVLATLCWLSEVAFGARLFGWHMPKMRGGGELDGAHDLILVVWRTLWEAPLFLAAAVAAALLLLLLIAAYRGAARAGLSVCAGWQWLASEPQRLTILAATFYLAAALACDLLEQPALRQVEEPLELVAAFLLLVSQWKREWPRPRACPDSLGG